MLTSARLRLIEAYNSFPWLNLRGGGVDLDFRSSVFTGVGEALEGFVLSALRDHLSVASLLHV